MNFVFLMVMRFGVKRGRREMKRGWRKMEMKGNGRKRKKKKENEMEEECKEMKNRNTSSWFYEYFFSWGIPSGALLGGLLGASWRLLGVVWGHLGRSWRVLRAIFAPSLGVSAEDGPT